MKSLAIFAVMGVWAAMIPLQNSIDLDRHSFPTEEKKSFDTLQDVLLQAFSDFRIAVSNFIWIRVDQYLHLYLMRMQLDTGHEGHEHKHAHELGVDHDEAACAEYQEALEAWRREMERQMMPLIRIVTWLDPHFILAYQVGGWTLGERLGKTNEAEKFLKEGIGKNPHRYELYHEIGFLYFFQLEDYPQAAWAFEKALDLPIESKNELRKLMRMLAYSYERAGDLSKAIETLEAYLEIDPGNGKARIRLENLKQMLNQRRIPVS